MTGEASRIECQSTLSGPNTLDTSASKRTSIVLGVIGCVERGGRVLRQTLSTVPGHVLNSEQSTVGAEEHIKVTRADDRVISEFDDTLQNTVVGRTRRRVRSGAAVVSVTKDVNVSTLEPVGVERSVKSLLDVGAVEVDDGTWRRVITSIDYAKLAVWVGTCFRDVVNVEAGVRPRGWHSTGSQT